MSLNLAINRREILNDFLQQYKLGNTNNTCDLTAKMLEAFRMIIGFSATRDIALSHSLSKGAILPLCLCCSHARGPVETMLIRGLIKTQEGPMAKTASYCSDCYNKIGRNEDGQIQSAEKNGQVPMTEQGTCCKCNNKTVVVFYEN